MRHQRKFPGKTKLLMVVGLASLYSLGQRGFLFVKASSKESSTKSSFQAKTGLRSLASNKESPKRLKVVQVQIVHRHGDRTPITPMADEEYWKSTLVDEQLLQRVSATVRIVREEGKEIKHLAGGRGPFGKLTQLGLLQMVDLGSQLRLQLQGMDENEGSFDEYGNYFVNKGRLFSRNNPISPSQIKVFSTDFPRTLQSVSGTLVGLFPEPDEIVEPIEIDARHTSTMIPDPQPRRSKEQEELEKSMSRRTRLQQRDEELRNLATTLTKELRPLLAEDAFQVSFGVGEEKEEEDERQKPLSWAQLSEITKCLQVRDMLPKTISIEMQQTCMQHLAWKWFESLRNPRLIFLAMNTMATRITDSMRNMKNGGKGEKPLYLYSAHDSTLIGLLCAFRLSQPAKWPEYGSYLKIELIEIKEQDNQQDTAQGDLMVRFSLNGEVLFSQWDEGESLEMIALDYLIQRVKTEGCDTE